MPALHLSVYFVQIQTAEELSFNGGYEVTLFARVGFQRTCVDLGKLVTRDRSDFVQPFFRRTRLASNVFVDDGISRIGRIQSEYARIPYSHLVPGLEDTPETDRNLTTIDFSLSDSQNMIRVPSSTGAAHSKTKNDVDNAVQM